MNYRDFKSIISVDANWPRGYEQIVFKTPDGTTYTNAKASFGHFDNSKNKIILVELFTIKPKFKVGDVVCNKSGLYPNVKCTITEVNEKLQYYSYKETDGITYFKDQDKLMLINNEEVPPPVENDAMYLDVKEVKAIQAKAVAAKVGSSIIESIMKDIKKAAAEGKSEIKIKYKDYNISNNHIPYVCYWARICRFIVGAYEELMYIKWY